MFGFSSIPSPRPSRPEPAGGAGAPAREEDAPALLLEGVTRSFEEGGRTLSVLAGVDLEVAPGELVALLGPSGSGKSTLLNVIAGIDRPDGGRVEVAGIPIHTLGEKERTLFRRRHLGFVFQFFNLIPTLTVEENLLLPLELAGRTRPEDRERVAELLARVGLSGREGAWPDRLSGGEQQRVAMARALSHSPALVLADEPTGNLDEGTGAGVLDLLEELVEDTGTTLVLVTHSPSAAARAGRTLHLREGRLHPGPRAP